MDLKLTDEQTWVAESIETLLEREWPGDPAAATAAGDRDRVWARLSEFGALTIGGDDGLGVIELCLVARVLGTRLVSSAFVGTAAVRAAASPLLDELPVGFAALCESDDRVSVALMEPGTSWSRSALRAEISDGELSCRKAAVEHAEDVQSFAVVTRSAVVLVPAGDPGVAITPRPSLDARLPIAELELSRVRVTSDAVAEGALAERLLARVMSVGGLLAAAESVGAAERMLEDARRYAAERRQFGRTIGANQALRHLLADMYVRRASSWSAVLYAAAALDNELDEAQATAAVAKAYVARAAREVAHGALQVFGGIAFTEEHPAHRYLRRIVAREQQFGDAAHHERELGRLLASRLAA